MNRYDNTRRLDTFELERQARRMQAEAMAEGMRNVGRWLRRRIG